MWNKTETIMADTYINSKVEQFFLEKSRKKLIYKPTEKISVIQVDNFPELGKLTALRFIEWVQKNPKGVIALPTGKTPEYFIKWLEKILKEWNSVYVKEILKKVGIETQKRPIFSNLRFVQIDEFYPIDSRQHNSFYYYIKKYYFKILGLDPNKALLINVNKIPTPHNLPLSEIFPNNVVDLSLRTRFARNGLEKLQKDCIEIVDEFCMNYEKQIRDMGGIGFFLGGIGPDGHIGFNVRGSDHYSTTRLTDTNYETQAAASVDLGGIENAKNRPVITIGLGTITYNPEAVAIIIASGESKANIVRDSIQNNPSILFPATALQKLPNARFYLTKGATLRLSERRYIDLKEQKKLTIENIDRNIINLSFNLKKKLSNLTENDYASDKIAKLIVTKIGENSSLISHNVEARIKEKIEKGIKHIDNEVILHTGPHHDDIMLGYLHYINHLVRNPNNKHHFVVFTSGFTAVTNSFMLNLLESTKHYIDLGLFDKLFDSGYFLPDLVKCKNNDIHLYLDGVAQKNRTLKEEANAKRLIRNIIEIYSDDSIKKIKERLKKLIDYFKTQYPGTKDTPHVQKLKGLIREWEEEIVWARYGFSVSDVSHLRLGFYQGDIFTETPQVHRDVLPVVDLLEKIKPTIVTVALDPESSGPDTHYKVMQVISEALKIYHEKYNDSNIRIWGYRNIWSRFHPAEANVYIPISLNSFAILENTFLNSYESQKDASFPSWELNGPFNELAQQIQIENFNIIRTCIGSTYFINSSHPRLRSAKGILFMKELSLEEFHKYSIDLKKLTELIE